MAARATEVACVGEKLEREGGPRRAANSVAGDVSLLKIGAEGGLINVALSKPVAR